MLPKKGQVSISLVCVVLGIILAVQFKNNQDFRYSLQNQRVEDLTLRLSSSEKEIAILHSQIRELQSADAAHKEAQRIAMGAGTLPLTGPGIIVTLEEDRRQPINTKSSELYLIRAEDMLKILNELRAGGAEAIAINNQRLITGSGIIQNGQSMSVNGTDFAAPFEIRAIGDPATLENSLKMRGGVIETLSFWGIKITVSQQPDIQLPAYTGVFHFQYAKPVEQTD
ncbi:DUF881 domain-containing protein [Sporomusa termitida]|uniref:Division initiation protein n=1 Tax=Sporomusa termitida TaxID=2377 RepID=A0A517DW11_9FIRM|nr:DUF881 domain-containing protein [Sporomusa termitida]QDR81517.1 hypothetical protein SPTER_29030 [Sporomusa termitida]